MVSESVSTGMGEGELVFDKQRYTSNDAKAKMGRTEQRLTGRFSTMLSEFQEAEIERTVV